MSFTQNDNILRFFLKSSQLAYYDFRPSQVEDQTQGVKVEGEYLQLMRK